MESMEYELEEVILGGDLELKMAGCPPNKQEKVKVLKMPQYYMGTMQDPVTEQEVKWYIVPMDWVVRAGGPDGQPRLMDSSSKSVSDIADSFIVKGMTTPICVRFDEVRKKFVVLWGNTRYRALLRVGARGEMIPGLQSGFIKIFEFPDWIPEEDITDYQTKENNMKDPHTPAKLEDNVASLQTAKNKGKLTMQVDGKSVPYSQLNDLQKQMSVKRYAKKFIQAYSKGDKFNKLWKAWVKEDKETSASMRAWEKEEMRQWVNLHNKFGVPVPKFNGLSSGAVIVVGGKRIKIYFHNAHDREHSASFEHGVNVAKYHKSNPEDELVDEVWVVAALNRTARSLLLDKRKACEDRYRGYPNQLNGVKYIDKLFWIPQTDSEWYKERERGQWVGQVNY